ncbi:hypothetical protein MATL_G00259480 [Megalops atlanticus]|uniref:Tetraspanin n=1 Tax=Megalops atlanticus TaxID=7932 RepID=A0A9D3STZ5_MEGAT|nr:hypothetical protein MATL_G00259480 [Megalops atlanticus]
MFTMRLMYTCLKWIFFSFNFLIGIIGCYIPARLMNMYIYNYDTLTYIKMQKFQELITSLVIGFITVVIGFLGALGTGWNKKWALSLYFKAMAFGLIFQLSLGLLMCCALPVVFSDTLPEFLADAVPLDKADEKIQDIVERMHEQMRCCGLLKGYEDWGQHIPDSCLCPDEYLKRGMCVKVKDPSVRVPRHSTNRHRSDKSSFKQVYKNPCFPIYAEDKDWMFGLLKYIFIGLVMMTVIVMVITKILLHQIS